MSESAVVGAKSADETNRAIAHLRPFLTYPAWFCAVSLIILAQIAPNFLTRWQWVPFTLGILFLGLPHGAWDHRVWPALAHERVSAQYLAAFIAGYGALVGLYGAFWVALPGAAFAVFLLFSWLHWGQGEAWYLRVFGKRRAHSFPEMLVIWLVRGGLPIVLPCLAFSHVFAGVASGITARFGLGGANWSVLLGPLGRGAGFAFLGLFALLYVCAAWKQKKQTPRFGEDMGEIALLWLLFGTVNPVVSVGVYFGIWHGARHIARLILTDDTLRRAAADGKTAQAIGFWARQSFPVFSAALLLLGGLYQIYAPTIHGLHALIYLYLAYIAALTFPHFLLVIWMDSRQGLFSFRRLWENRRVG